MIDVENLSAVYPGGHTALKNLSFRIPTGCAAALPGANGAGKSSLFQVLTGLLPASAGCVRMAGIELSRRTLTEIRRKTGLVFQNPDDRLFCARVEDDIAFGPRNMGLSSEETETRIETAIRDMPLEELRARSPQRLSEGEKRSAAIAGVLAMRPDIILFDEPTSQPDPRGRRQRAELLSSLPQTRLIATHDLGFAEKVCTHALVLKRGEKAAFGPLSDVLSDRALLYDCGLA